MEKKDIPSVQHLSVQFHSISVPVRVMRRLNQKHIRLRIAANGEVSMSAPLRTPLREVKRVLSLKESWILAGLEKRSREIRQVDPLKQIFFKGEAYSVSFEETSRRRFLVQIDHAAGTFRVTGPLFDRPGIEKALAKHLHREAREELTTLAQEISARTGIPYERLFIRNQRTRWGSSSSIGNISLNWRTIMLPEEVQHYLLVHELAHQNQLNHSGAFWKLVELHCPRYRQHEKVLKQSRILMDLFRN